MISLLLTYKYVILFPLAVVEGPILTVIAGLFVKTGVLNLYLVYIIVVLGDMFGDTLAYSIGRFGGPLVLRKFSKLWGITDAKVQKAKEYFDLHHHKTLIFSKIIHGVGVAGLITAGNLKISYKKFFFMCLCVSLMQSAILLTIGVLFGHAYAKINQYLGFFSSATIILAAVIILIIYVKSKAKKI